VELPVTESEGVFVAASVAVGEEAPVIALVQAVITTEKRPKIPTFKTFLLFFITHFPFEHKYKTKCFGELQLTSDPQLL
jgi:hypothetical protein